MLRQLTKISAVSLGNIFNAVLGLVFITAIARVLPVADFGKYALLTSLLVLASKLIDFGTNSLFVAKSIKDDTNQQDMFLTLKLVLFCIALPLSILTLYFLDLLTIQIFILYSAGLFAYGNNITLFAFFQKLEQFHLVVGLNTIPALVKAFAGGVIFLGLATPTMTEAFGIFALSMLFSMFLAYFLPSSFKKFRVNFTGVKAFLGEAAPAGISLTVDNGWSAISNALAKITHTFTDVGILSIADRFANIFTLLSVSIFTVLLPKNARRKREELAYDIRETIVLSVIIILLAGFVIAFSETALTKLFGVKYLEAVPLLNIMIFASAITAIYTFISNYFFIEEQTKKILVITLSRLGVFLVVAVTLIPQLAITGIAYAQLVSACVAVLLTGILIFSGQRKIRAQQVEQKT